MSNQPCIAVEDLWYEYDGPVTALKGVSLEIEDGDYAAIIGQNGSGKTTLVKHFNGLLKPTRGSVQVYGVDTGDKAVGQLARQVGYVFQNPDHQIFCPTTREEISFGPRNLGLPEAEVEERTREAIACFGLEAHANRPPAVLGFGLRRKISIAAVYSMRPQIIILDEPTAGLDWRSTRELLSLVSELHQRGHTIILVTHDMQIAAEVSHHSLVLRDGRIVAHDDTRTVFRHAELLRGTHIEPPQITELARRMGHVGMADDVLTVGEFHAAFCEKWGHNL